MLYTHLPYHNDSIIKTHAERRMKKGRRIKTQEDFFTTYIPLTLLQVFERVIQALHVRGCWRPDINFIFWPHCYDRHVVSFLFSCCSTWGLGLTLSGVSEGPLGRVWPSLPHLISGCLEFYWQLHRGFPRSPSVRCGLPYHISSLTLWESAGNCFGTLNSTELNNNSTPTRSPTGSLNRVFNRHQAEITVMQFRGYSLPVHHC